MNVSGITARIGAFLEGDAGVAMKSLAKVREAATATRGTFLEVLEGDVGFVKAARTMNIGDKVFGLGRTELRTAVNAAKPALTKVLGSDQRALSATLHTDLRGIFSARNVLGTSGADTARALAAARSGVAHSDAVLAAIGTVEAAARRSAITKVGVGALGVGAAAAGVVALWNAAHAPGHDTSRVIAPGRFGPGVPGFDPSFDPTGLVL